MDLYQLLARQPVPGLATPTPPSQPPQPRTPRTIETATVETTDEQGSATLLGSFAL